jgi:hypothetical protein
MGINRFSYIEERKRSELGLYQSVGQTYGRVVGMVGKGHARGGCIVIPCGYLASLPFLVSGAAVVWLLVL